MRHICGISGGKDSSALAVYMRDRVPDMEYFFCEHRCRTSRDVRVPGEAGTRVGQEDSAAQRREGLQPLLRDIPRHASVAADAVVHQPPQDKAAGKSG